MEGVRYRQVGGGRRGTWDGRKLLRMRDYYNKKLGRVNVLRLKMCMKFKTRIVNNYLMKWTSKMTQETKNN